MRVRPFGITNTPLGRWEARPAAADRVGMNAIGMNALTGEQDQGKVIGVTGAIVRTAQTPD